MEETFEQTMSIEEGKVYKGKIELAEADFKARYIRAEKRMLETVVKLCTTSP